MKLPKTKLVLPRPSRDHWLMIVQLIGLLAVLVGISIWSVPAAFIVGGIAVIAAIEMQSPKDESSADDREIKDLIDRSVAAGQNPFTDERVPMTEKWLAYARLITRTL